MMNKGSRVRFRAGTESAGQEAVVVRDAQPNRMGARVVVRMADGSTRTVAADRLEEAVDRVHGYYDALRDGNAAGASKATDSQVMAMFLDSFAQILLGAVSPKLVWEGAQDKGMTALQLVHLIGKDPRAAEELQWLETS